MSARTFKLIGAAGAAALTVGVMAGPAVAAGEETADVNYTCTTALGLTPAPTAHYAVDAPPATMVAGQTVKLGVSLPGAAAMLTFAVPFTVPASQTQIA